MTSGGNNFNDFNDFPEIVPTRAITTKRFFFFPQTCQVSRISHETHAFSMSLTLSLRTVEISRIFLLNEKQYF